MKNRVLIPHDAGLAPGTWFLSAGQPVHRCPECRKASAMVLHSVDENGDVNASIACFSPCGYHVWGTLDGWTHGEKKVGEVKFLDDCTHALKGQTVPVPDLPPWVVDHREETETMTDQNQDPADAQAAAELNAAGTTNAPEAEAPPPETDPAVQGAAGATEQPEPGAAPLETAQDQDPAAGDQAERFTLAFDTAHVAAMTAELKGHIDDGFTAVKAEFAQKMDELATHCEARIDTLADLLDAADISKVQALVDDAKAAVDAIRESGVADLGARLTTLEMRLRHSL